MILTASWKPSGKRAVPCSKPAWRSPGSRTLVRYPVLDMGSIELVFDGDPNTLARTLEANPFVIELVFPTARPVSGVSLGLGSAYLQVRVSLTTPADAKPVVFETTFQGSVAEPELDHGFWPGDHRPADAL